MNVRVSQLKDRIYARFIDLGWSQKRTTCTLLAGTALLLLLPYPAAAIFGIGDVVFDPTSYATLGKIWSQDATTYTKITEEVAQLDKIYAQGQAMYNQALAMAKKIDSLKRLKWKTVETAFVSDETPNRYGETANWPITVNGSSPFAKLAWKTGTLFLNSSTDTFLKKELLGNSGALASLASIEEQDGSASKCLATIAEYRTAANENLSAIDALQADDDADDDADNLRRCPTESRQRGTGSIDSRATQSRRASRLPCGAKHHLKQLAAQRCRRGDECIWHSAIVSQCSNSGLR